LVPTRRMPSYSFEKKEKGKKGEKNDREKGNWGGMSSTNWGGASISRGENTVRIEGWESSPRRNARGKGRLASR